MRARRAGKKPVVTNEYIEKFYEMTAAAEGLEARHQPSEALDMYEKAIGNMLAGIKRKAACHVAARILVSLTGRA